MVVDVVVSLHDAHPYLGAELHLGNPITKEEFIEKYPALIRIGKEFAKSLHLQ